MGEIIPWSLVAFRAFTEKRQIPKAISSLAVAWSSKASIHSSSPQTNLLAGSLSISTDESIQAHPLNDVHLAQGRDILYE